MAFLSPWMLFGALAASIPIALHFLYRSRFRVVPWAAMEFLLTGIQQTSRRLKFQELLLLLFRCALLVLLALALARPTTEASRASNGSGGGESIDAVLLFDVSASMGARDGTKTRLDQAKAAALQIIDNLPPSSTVRIITCADRATLLGPRSPGNLDQARELIATLTPTELATDFLPGFEEASKALERGHLINREIYLLSDMQKLGWEQQSTALRTKLKEISDKAQIYAVRCGTRKVRNTAIVGLVGQSGIPHVGERTAFAVLVRNTGTEALRDLTVSLTVDNRTYDRDSLAMALIGPGETRTVPLTALLRRPGQQVITATVGPDDLDGDNRFDQIIQVRDQLRVLVVDGSPNQEDPNKSASFYLLTALQPVPDSKKADYPIQPRVVVPRLASPVLLQDKDVCILVDVPLRATGNNLGGHLPADFVDRLASFVRAGRGLLIFAGPRVEPDAYNQILDDKHHLLPLRLGKPYGPQGEKRLNPDVTSVSPFSYLAAFRDKPLDTLLANVDVKQALATDALPIADEKSGGSRIDLCYTNGKPALASRTVGRGEVLLCTTTCDPRWTDLPLWPAYIPLVHSALGELVQSSVQAQNRVVGQPITWVPANQDEARSYRLTLPSGDETILSPGYQELLTVTNTQRAGVYKIGAVVAEGNEERITRPEGEDRKEAADALFAVTPDLRETKDLGTFSNAEIDEQAGIGLIHLTAGQELNGSGADRSKREWTGWLLGALLAMLVFETALAWYCGRAW